MIANRISQITKTLKEERCRQNMSTAKLSLLSGVNIIVIRQYEKDQKHQITLSTLIRIAYALKLDISVLFPYTIQKEDHVAQQFDSMIQGLPLSTQSINIILKMAQNIANYMESV